MIKIIGLALKIISILFLCQSCVTTNNLKDFRYKIENNTITITAYRGNVGKITYNVIIPESIENRPVTKIGREAFFGQGNFNIKSIVIPDTVIEIEDTAFLRIDNLTDVTLSKNLEYINRAAFANCNNLLEIIIPSTVKTIGVGAFNPGSIKSIKIPGNLNLHGERVEANKAFPHSFDTWYDITGRREGLYTYENDIWYLDGNELSLSSFGLIVTENGVEIITINGKNPAGFNTIKVDQRENIVLEQGTYDIILGYFEMQGNNIYRSTINEKVLLPINSGKTIIISGSRGPAVGNSFNWFYSIAEK